MEPAQQDWNDLTEMTFGKWKGTPLQDIPASHAHWFWHNVAPIKGRDSWNYMKYIKNAIEALRMENRDLIWDLTLHKEL